jgi:hypothetical protein
MADDPRRFSSDRGDQRAAAVTDDSRRDNLGVASFGGWKNRCQRGRMYFLMRESPLIKSLN